MHQCAPHVAQNTMQAIITTESRGNPLAIGLNRGFRLTYQPKNYHQAVMWVKYLEKHHYNFDIGLTQVNIHNVYKYGYTGVNALDPCTNIKIAAAVLQQDYSHALHGSFTQQDALLKAISAYNTGNNLAGFSNGYVYRVVHNAGG